MTYLIIYLVSLVLTAAFIIFVARSAGHIMYGETLIYTALAILPVTNTFVLFGALIFVLLESYFPKVFKKLTRGYFWQRVKLPQPEETDVVDTHPVNTRAVNKHTQVDLDSFEDGSIKDALLREVKFYEACIKRDVAIDAIESATAAIKSAQAGTNTSIDLFEGLRAASARLSYTILEYEKLCKEIDKPKEPLDTHYSIVNSNRPSEAP